MTATSEAIPRKLPDPIKGRVIWAMILASLAGSIYLAVAGFYQYSAGILVCAVVLTSFFNPVYGILLTIATFPFDQFVSGVAPDVLAPGRYLVVVNVLFCLPRLLTGRTGAGPVVARQLILYASLIALGIVAMSWSANLERAAIYLVKMMILLMWVWLVSGRLANHDVLRKTSILLCFVTFFVALVMLFGGIGRLSNINDRLLLEGLGINSIATSFGFCIVFSTVALLESRIRLEKVALIVAILVIYLAILKMGTRSVAIGVPLALVIGACLAAPQKIVRNVLYGFLALLTCFALLMLAVQNGLISERLAQRFTALTDVATFTSDSRTSLAFKSFSFFVDNPMGAGPGNEAQVFASSLGGVDIYESHNTFLSTMVQFGVLGIILLVLAHVDLARAVFSIEGRVGKFVCGSLSGFFVLSLLKASLLQTRLYWIPLGVILSLITLQRIDYVLRGANRKRRRRREGPVVTSARTYNA